VAIRLLGQAKEVVVVREAEVRGDREALEVREEVVLKEVEVSQVEVQEDQGALAVRVGVVARVVGVRQEGEGAQEVNQEIVVNLGDHQRAL